MLISVEVGGEQGLVYLFKERDRRKSKYLARSCKHSLHITSLYIYKNSSVLADNVNAEVLLEYVGNVYAAVGVLVLLDQRGQDT